MTTFIPSRTVTETSAAIMELLLEHRRTADATPSPVAAFTPQLSQLAHFVERGEQIVLTMPAFPCKSPNPAKVLGKLPDQGEYLSLLFLNDLCHRIQKLHAPGARLIICSDGHIFSDFIRVPDDHVDAYADELRALINKAGLTQISVFDLREVLGKISNDDKRALVHDKYAPSVDDLRAQMRTDEETLRLYRGITRFLVEDTADFEGTRSALQRECRRRAYGVIQRSRAWGDLIADHFPATFRLSIHPQHVGSPKYGIRLLESPDAWMTPWHSTALLREDGTWQLLPRAKAEEAGRLIVRDGRASHFEAVPSAS
ncbi:L-tyrosine/L-tryptophan isonitrile synthase family protein [Streptomyces tubercidicus]|uniref:L-tyrosine/L-tryptophan isonitrile synthase family protein n=1 Tax=Streptomyces tubercidicus TaxID=47759 RepID=UPI003467A4AF